MIKYFVEPITNLNCKALIEYHWYKDIFLTKVYQLEDSNYNSWKENFISELPNLFVERVRATLYDDNNGHIPYQYLQYGDLIK